MLVCPERGKDVYIQQHLVRAVWAANEPYYCWSCDEFLTYDEVEVEK